MLAKLYQSESEVEIEEEERKGKRKKRRGGGGETKNGKGTRKGEIKQKKKDCPNVHTTAYKDTFF